MANPLFIPFVFAANGVKNVIQKTLQVGQDPQDATWENGWGSITFTPIENGGKPPKGQDFNGVLNAFGDHIVFNQNGNRYQWSQSVIDEFGGYNQGAIVQSDDTTKEFLSLEANNTVNPNNGLGGKWVVYAGQGSIPIATSTTVGITKVLNVLNSTDIASALSAAQGKVLNDKFVFQNSKLSNGYVKIGDSGLILQWGVVDYSSNPEEISVSVNYPLVFPLASLNVSLTRKSIANNLADGNVTLVSQSNTGFTAQFNTWNTSGTSDLRGFTWFAIGY